MYRLFQGDCLEEMDKLIVGGTKVDMILTDLPYSCDKTRAKWDSEIDVAKMFVLCKKILNKKFSDFIIRQ